MIDQTLHLPEQGLLVIDKPRGITSRDVVNRVQQQWPHGTKVGHTGTLDPLATGVLVVCLGQATRLAEFVQQMPKTYHATIRLGATSPTDDADGDIVETKGVAPVDVDALSRTMLQFVGDIQQKPPAFSALKQGGTRAYQQARSGRRVDLRPRQVRVDAFRLIRYEWPYLEVVVDCGKGTYIRSLARDLGQALGVGGLMTALRRTRVGPFDESRAIPLAQLATPHADMVWPMHLAVAHLPSWPVSEDERWRLSQGQRIAAAAAPGLYAVFEGDELTAIGDSDGRCIRPVKVFVSDERAHGSHDG